MARVDFKFDDIELKKNIEEFGPQINKTLTLATDNAADIGVRNMKLKAPWTDRTTNARSGLNTKVDHSGSGAIGFTKHSIVFAHAVSYGIWLELIKSGKYAIIMPTVLAVGKDLMKALEGMLDSIGKEPHLQTSLDLPNARPQKARPDARARAEAHAASIKSGKRRGGSTPSTKQTKKS